MCIAPGAVSALTHLWIGTAERTLPQTFANKVVRGDCFTYFQFVVGAIPPDLFPSECENGFPASLSVALDPLERLGRCPRNFGQAGMASFFRGGSARVFSSRKTSTALDTSSFLLWKILEPKRVRFLRLSIRSSIGFNRDLSIFTLASSLPKR